MVVVVVVAVAVVVVFVESGRHGRSAPTARNPQGEAVPTIPDTSVQGPVGLGIRGVGPEGREFHLPRYELDVGVEDRVQGGPAPHVLEVSEEGLGGKCVYVCLCVCACACVRVRTCVCVCLSESPATMPRFRVCV